MWGKTGRSMHDVQENQCWIF